MRVPIAIALLAFTAGAESARTTTTADNMAVLALALKAYHLQHGRYPAVASMRELEPLLHPDLVSKVGIKDAWGNEYRYVAIDGGRSYRLVSAGADGRFDEPTWTKHGPLAKSAEDAVTEDGEPVRQWDEHTDAPRGALDPRARALLDRADAVVKDGDHDGALKAYVEAVRIDKRAASLEAIERYRAPFSTANAAPLVAALRQYVELHPGSMLAVRELAGVSDPAEAEQLIAPMLRAAPNDPELYALRGRARAQGPRPEEALPDFVKSAELDPDNADRHYTLGVVLYELATKGANVGDARKKELIARGIAALERAESLRAGYFEAMSYRSLLLRAAASLETDPARQAELTRQADAVREQARAAIAARRK